MSNENESKKKIDLKDLEQVSGDTVGEFDDILQ